MLKAIWKLLLMFNGVSSDDDERRAERARAAEKERLRRERGAEEQRDGKEASERPKRG